MPFVPENEITQDALDKPHLWRMSQLGDHSKRVNAIHITKTGSHLTKMWMKDYSWMHTSIQHMVNQHLYTTLQRWTAISLTWIDSRDSNGRMCIVTKTFAEPLMTRVTCLTNLKSWKSLCLHQRFCQAGSRNKQFLHLTGNRSRYNFLKRTTTLTVLGFYLGNYVFR